VPLHHPRNPSNVNRPAWWHGATIYQIYPRSFLDTNADGVGDLPGIIERLDYVAQLGVDAIWISPFFRSPMADFGYDIADYRAVDPLFGTLEDLDHLVQKAHRLGLKVMIDQVLSHTSSQHPWFLESRESRENPKANWYVWADPREDGGPPNNWLSIFGGVAWAWEPRRAQYYLHNFLAEQPDLNFHEPAVRAAALENLAFWLDRGIDGFRMDAINFCFHDASLRGNPPKPAALRNGRGVRAENPYAYQYHVYDNTRPENLAFLGEVRALLDRYPGTVSLGEISAEDSTATMAEYTRPGRLHMAYSFELLGAEHSPQHIRATVENLLQAAPQGWPCWAISNHDVERVVDRWGKAMGPDADAARLAPQLSALIFCLRGAACVYQGEELGLGEAEVPYENLRDPYGIAFWPNFKGRDGCRTPMPWSDRAGAGFSSARPWLPIPAKHLALSVARQEAGADSALARFRRFLHWRNQHAALRWGNISFVAATDTVLAFWRTTEDERLFIAFNLSANPASLVLPAELGKLATLDEHGLDGGTVERGQLVLPAHGVYFGIAV